VRGASLAVVAAIGLLSTGAPVAAQDDDAPDDDALVAVHSVSSAYDVGDHLAVRVTVAADQLIDGHVELRGGASSTTVRHDVQVAGGATEEFHVLVPSSQFGDARIAVELFDGGESVDVDTVTFTHDAGRDVAGVLPLLLARIEEPPERVTLDGDVRRVTLAPLPVELMSLGASAISQLDSIAAASDDLEALDADALDALLTWVDGGGHLVLDDADELGALPTRWQPGEPGYALAGKGEIRLVDGLIASGDWAHALQPVPLAPGDSPMGFSGMDVMLDPRITLAQRAGVSLPNLTVIVAILGGYVFLIGPVLYLVLRRARRLTAAWLAIPAVAVLLAAAVAVIGSGWRTSGRPTSSTVLEVRPGGGYAHADLLVFSRSGGTESVGLPDGWVTADQTAFGFFDGQPTANRTMVSDDDGDRIETRLETGQIAVFNVEGSQAFEAMTVDARMTADRTVTGTVTNTTTVTLHEVGVFAGGRGVLVGDIEAGEAKEYTIKNIADTPDPFSSALGSVWPNPNFGPVPQDVVDDDSLVDFGIWTSFAARAGDGLYPSGLARAAGWTDELAASVDDDDAFLNSTLVTSLAPIMSDGDTLRPAAVRVSFIESTFDPRTGQPGEPVVRYVVPPDAVGQAFELEIPRGITEVELLDEEGEWERQDIEDVDDEEVVVVPDDAMRSGSLLVRFTLDFSQPIDMSSLRPTLRGAAA
jgi:hypothetical protein